MRRKDGVLLKPLDPFVQIVPYIMEQRSDAQNFTKHVFPVETIDHYIKEKKEKGLKITYLHFFMAAYVRIIAERPQLNRFIMNSRIYQRNNICISMTMKHSLRGDEGEDITVKFEFTGRENIFEVVETIDKLIEETRTAKNNTETDKLAAVLMSTPGLVKKLLVKSLKAMDRANLLPESVIKASPFHTTVFFTYLKSIHTNYIYHHLYNFGTTGLFVALGKTVRLPVVEGDEIVIRKCCQIGYTMDERICDGLYFAKTFKLLEKYIENPHLLETGAMANAEAI